MSAFEIAQNTFTDGGATQIPKKFFENLVKEYPSLPPIEELLENKSLLDGFQLTQKKFKKTITPEERRGQYDSEKCDARIWKAAKGAGQHVGFDDIQCSAKKVNGTCLCRAHANKIDKYGPWWLGMITEKRPENPIGPPSSKEPCTHMWSTDEDGNEVTRKKEKKPKKEKKEKKKKKDDGNSYENMNLDQLKLLLASKEKEAADLEEDESSYGEEKDEEKDEEDYENIIVDGIEYQMNKEDKTVLDTDNFELVGVWNSEKGNIIFEDEEAEENHKGKIK